VWQVEASNILATGGRGDGPISTKERERCFPFHSFFPWWKRLGDKEQGKRDQKMANEDRMRGDKNNPIQRREILSVIKRRRAFLRVRGIHFLTRVSLVLLVYNEISHFYLIRLLFINSCLNVCKCNALALEFFILTRIFFSFLNVLTGRNTLTTLA
jgi:hypothetical protein